MPFSRGSSQPRDLPRSPALPADSLPSEPPVSLITAAMALIYVGLIAVPHLVLNHMLFHLILVTHVDINYVFILLSDEHVEAWSIQIVCLNLHP